MRIRSIKPSYWSDYDLQKHLTAEEREFYIGLWQQADDAGWLVWDVHRIGAELYPFKATARREAFIARVASKLVSLDPVNPHLVIHECGHARVPKMPGHQHLSGKPVYTVRNAHEQGCPQVPAVPRDLPQVPATVMVSNGEVSNGGVRGGNGSETLRGTSGLPPGWKPGDPLPDGYSSRGSH